ncbi:GGDEF domain-containing protein [Streptomyces spiroverticillatus]|uniref:GGDEF domain-containing protein n=1 Tax=Streptomyces finlayi TaxID=67296 RepID=A0A919CEK9_9ACTN|nr:GGDEF domain-containing protein [Streptomyces finlayi]GHA45904.1 GGDEF domain-containing protein [Streptomyces spiroverticillatus]GHD15960.1 GGDEF domain-containing protein [Streptomyces finlayi]
MDSVLRAYARIGQRALLLTTAAVPLTGWAVHAAVLHRQLAAKSRDPLTGLLRRDAYTARAHRILRRHRHETTVVLIDQDHLKTINDRHGHAAGDTALAETAARLTTWAGPHAAIGRLGGDEFALVLALPAKDRHERLQQLVTLLSTPVTLPGGWPINVGASVGAAATDTLDTRDLSALQRAADAALYDGKHSGRAVLATPVHASTRSVNGRRAGRPGTHQWGRAA